MNTLSDVLRLDSVWIWGVLDIAIVALLVHELLKLVRRTHAVQVFIGGGLVIALYYISQVAPLQTLNWLIRDMFGYIVFAAIVLFQVDIRRALVHLGQARFFRYFSRPETTDETIEELVVALHMLAEERIGAIVVIERDIGLRSFVESGIPLDATVSYDLLVTVFRPGSPLHDGAVVIQQDRVAAAACFLPLTVNPRVAKDLGTRHRAAIGLSEETDAIALVVSEETGQISLVLDGQLERDLESDQLRYRLEALMLHRGRSAGKDGTRGLES